MITKIPAAKRHYSDYGSLKTYWLFSFSDYYDPENMNFGVLRVFNDDSVMPGAGFPDHPHDTMEIITIVLEGTLTHGDSMGNKATITAGEVQRMSAGEGVVHSEFNNHKDPVHLYQLWLYPNKETKADYEQKKIDFNKTGLIPLASPTEKDALKLSADATIWQLNMKGGDTVERLVVKGRGLFVYVTVGALVINNETYEAGDQARIAGEEKILITSESAVRALVIDVAL